MFMARIIAYLRANGGFTIVQTQELGNCLYAAFLRGTAAKREVTSMHVRRMLVMMLLKNHHFFFEFLKVPLAKHYGHERIAAFNFWTSRKERVGAQKPMQGTKDFQVLSTYSPTVSIC